MDIIQKKYLRRAKIVAGLLSICPFVRAVFLTGSVARGEATEKSDIDFFMVTKRERLFSGRFFSITLVKLLGLKVQAEKIAGRICLNCYQTENHLLVSPQVKYVANDYSKAIVLWAGGNLYQNFIVANKWVEKFGYKLEKNNQKTPFFLQPLVILQFIFEAIFELIFHDFGEKILKKYQVKKIINNPLTKTASKDQIFISDKELRFHPLKKS
jgi:predicted nucleotidyltransferase